MLKSSSCFLNMSGCMAERLKDNLLEKGKVVDIVAGPDSYRSLPYLLSHVSSHQVCYIEIKIVFFYVSL